MKVTAQEEYGLRCMLQLAKGHGTEPLLSRAIAGREGLSTDYVKKILMCLRHGGLVASVRGVKGGYELARCPKTITVGQVLEALSEDNGVLNSPDDQLCRQYSGRMDICIHVQECVIRPMWNVVAGYISSVLERISLDDLLQEEACVRGLCEQAMIGPPGMAEFASAPSGDAKLLRG